MILLVFLAMILSWTTSNEIDIDNLNISMFEENVKLTYLRLMDCITTVNGEISPPSADIIINHFNEIQLITNQYRGMKPHVFSGYKGPWIENHFIKSFIDKPVTYFNGFIPLFVQWTDYELLHRNDKDVSSYFDIFRSLFAVLRRDMAYIVVSQHNRGLRVLNEHFPNAVVMSSGGYGHIPLPLLKDEYNYIEPPTSMLLSQSSSHKSTQISNAVSTPHSNHQPELVNIGFYGTVNHGNRRIRIITEIQKLLQQPKFSTFHVTIGSSPHWVTNISHTLFNLAPRGHGRTSFRLAEIIQIGRIPVYIYDDIPWLPYDNNNNNNKNNYRNNRDDINNNNNNVVHDNRVTGTYITNTVDKSSKNTDNNNIYNHNDHNNDIDIIDDDISVRNIGYVGRVGKLDKLLTTLLSATPQDIQSKLFKVKSARYYYTYQGVMQQIHQFITTTTSSHTNDNNSRDYHSHNSLFNNKNNINSRISYDNLFNNGYSTNTNNNANNNTTATAIKSMLICSKFHQTNIATPKKMMEAILEAKLFSF